jgi:hypothetical protein
MSIVTYEVLKYYKNKDASIMLVKKFGGKNRKDFPAITFCFQSGDYPLHEGLYNKSYIESNLNISSSLYRDTLLGKQNMTYMKGIVDLNFELATFNLRHSLRKFRVQDTNENEYRWKYDENLETPNFEYRVNQPFGWQKKKNLTKNLIPMMPSYVDPKIKCFTHHPMLDTGIIVDSVDLYFYIPKLEEIEEGQVYIYVHQNEQLIRNMRYLYKLRHFNGVSRNNSNNQLVFDLNYVRVMKSREDARETCDKELENDDQEYMKQVSTLVGCVPAYWKTIYSGSDNHRVCESKTKYELLSTYLAFKNSYGRNQIFDLYQPPCQRMIVLANTNTDKYDKEGQLKIKFRFRYFSLDHNVKIKGLLILPNNSFPVSF